MKTKNNETIFRIMLQPELRVGRAFFDGTDSIMH